MSPRAEHVIPAVQVKPVAIARALLYIGQALDLADYHSDTVMTAFMPDAHGTIEQSYAWMMAAFMIANVTEIDSMTLRNMATSIHKETQDVIF